jgi:hypothetical protein
MRNVREPVELVAVVREGEATGGRLVVDSVCRMAVDRASAAGRLIYEAPRTASAHWHARGSSPGSPNASSDDADEHWRTPSQLEPNWRGSPPYRWFRDEFRPWEDRTLIGLAFLDLAVLRRIGFPFALRRDGAAQSHPAAGVLPVERCGYWSGVCC